MTFLHISELSNMKCSIANMDDEVYNVCHCEFEIGPCRICSIVTLPYTIHVPLWHRPARVPLSPPHPPNSLCLYQPPSGQKYWTLLCWCFWGMIKPFSTSLPSVSFNRDKGKDPACNLCDLLLVSTGRLRPCGFWLQRIHYEFVNLFGGRGEWWGTMGSTVGWVVAWYYLKPFNKTGDSLAACLL